MKQRSNISVLKPLEVKVIPTQVFSLIWADETLLRTLWVCRLCLSFFCNLLENLCSSAQLHPYKSSVELARTRGEPYG